MSLVELLRGAGPILLALGLGVWVDRATAVRGLLLPGFASPSRRVAALLLVSAALWVGATASLGQIGTEVTIDPQTLAVPDLFLLHGVLLAMLVAWAALGLLRSGSSPASVAVRALRELGLSTGSWLRELGIGLGAGALLWPGVLVAMVAAALVVWAIGGEGILPTDPPRLVLWIAALPLAVKLGLSLSAGVVEELFFRGFLQPRVGIGLSSALFVLAHLSYDEPFMLVGVTLLSLSFGALVHWRQTIWPAIAAHALFDALQLIVLIPAVLDLQGG